MAKAGFKATAVLAVAAVVAGFGVAIEGSSATAQQRKELTGIDKIHKQARFGNRICMTTHRHYGEGTMPSRRGAEAAAIRKWVDFTAEEYGTRWGSHELSGNKSMTCKQEGGLWTCATIAHPCRPLR